MPIPTKMTDCRGCGKEFSTASEVPLSGSILRLTSLPLRRPFRWLAAGFLFGGVVMIVQTLIYTESIWLRDALLVILMVIGFLILVMLFESVFVSRRASRYCPECAGRNAERRLQRAEELEPHKVAVGKRKKA
ncbi:MAG TPA: hypothetical protein VGB78_03320 [Thermoplasmata archaeon]